MDIPLPFYAPLDALPALELNFLIEHLFLFFLNSIRLSAFLISSPFLGSRNVPLNAKIVFSMAISFFHFSIAPDLEINDKIHDVACKAVLKANSDILKIIDVLKNKKKLKLKRQTSNGKTFYSHDFKPEHLRLIYEKFDDQIVKMYLNGTIQPYKQFQFKQF